MALFNRFRTASAPTTRVDDDEEELKAIAKAKLAPPPTAPAPGAKQVVQPAITTKPLAPATVTQPPPAKPPTQILAPAAPRPAVSTGGTALSPVKTTDRLKAIDQLDNDDARSGFAHDPAGDSGGINVVGNGNRGTAAPVKRPIIPTLTTGPKVKPDDTFGVASIPKPPNVDDLLGKRDAADGEILRDARVDQGADESRRRRDSGEVYDPRDDREKAIDEGKDRISDRQAAIDKLSNEEQDAARADLAAGKAKALMMANARAQLAGMGLSGATAQLEGDIGRTQDRGAVLSMAELQRRQRDEGRDDRGLDIDERRAASAETRADADAEFTKLQRKIAINLLEEQTGQDQDDDGDVNDETPKQKAVRDNMVNNLGTEESGNDQADAVKRNTDGSADARDPNGPNGRFGHIPEVNGRLEVPEGMNVSSAELRDRRLMSAHVDWYFGSDGAYDYYESQVDGKIMKVKR